MLVELTAEDVAVLVGALNMVPVQGTEAMKRVLALVDKLEGKPEVVQARPA